MRLFSYLSVAVLLVSSVVLTAYSPDLLSMVIVGFMCMITLAGCIYGLLPTISFTGGLLNGQNSIRKASGTEGSSAWVAALRIERFFQQKRLDKLFGEYREKVQHQRETGQIVSDIDEVLNEDVLALYTWRGVIAQIPGTLTASAFWVPSWVCCWACGTSASSRWRPLWAAYSPFWPVSIRHSIPPSQALSCLSCLIL